MGDHIKVNPVESSNTYMKAGQRGARPPANIWPKKFMLTQPVRQRQTDLRLLQN
jgi:hypothetical protein